MTRLSRQRTLLAAVFLLAPSTGRSAVPEQAAADRDAPSSPLAATVRRVLQAEVDGDNATRKQLLERALHDDGDNPAAQWQRGYVRSAGRWVPYSEELDSIAGQREKVSAYQQTRATTPETVEGQLALAGLAREFGLTDEERAHLRRVVALDPEHAEARGRLGDERVDGFWCSREEVARLGRQLQATRSGRGFWDARVQPIVRQLLRSQRTAWEKNWQELQAIRDPAAIPSVEAALAAGDARAARWYLDWLDGVDAWEASVALARQAVLAPAAEVRTLAQQKLKPRPIDDYALALVGSLRSNPVHRSQVGFTPYGGLLYLQQFSMETQFDRRERNLAVFYGQEIVLRYAGTEPTVQDDFVTTHLALEHLRRHYGIRSHADSAELESRVEMLNGRILRAMDELVAEATLDSPGKCWDWFNQHHGLVLAGAKPLLKADYEEYWFVDRRQGRVQQSPTRVIAYCSCFAAGTRVVTESGPLPIDRVRIGDRVLSQDVDTGELAYKPVLQTTKSDAVPLMQIVTSDAELTCTPAHPYWVNGQGWRLARDLQPGDRFHGVNGAVEVESIAGSDRVEPAYNLIVADFHTYFAGDGPILSHDNTPRAPTNALVPGLMPDYTTVATVEQ